MTWPNQNPSSNSKGGLLASLASARGITNFSTLPWQAQIEVLLQNLLQDSPPGLGVGTRGTTVTALGTTQNSTPTAAQLLTGIVTQTSATGAGTVTLPLGSLFAAALPTVPATGASFQVLFINLGGGQTLTITGDTGMTVVGTATVASGTASLIVITCSGTDTFNAYCVASA